MKIFAIWCLAALLGAAGFGFNAFDGCPNEAADVQCTPDENGTCTLRVTCDDGRQCVLTVECRDGECVVTSCEPAADEGCSTVCPPAGAASPCGDA